MAKKLYSAYVQDGSDILLHVLADFIESNMKRVYRSDWWNEILRMFYNAAPALPTYGSDEELVDSLDFARCIKIITWRWHEVFEEAFGNNSRICSNYVHELLGVRNAKAHIGRKDLEQQDAERALDTMLRLCKYIDITAAEKIKDIYKVVRNGGNEAFIINEPTSIDVPTNVEIEDIPKESINNLKDLVGTDVVKKTTLTKKITLGGKEQAYPIYKVRLDYLYYNDQNDRVGTWISRYCAEKGMDSLTSLERDEYNNIVEEFVYESNPDAIKKTQKNILRYGQREPGVTLIDGRIVDGNRRYTCLRRIGRESTDIQYFETVLIDVDAEADKKKIKLLELAIQHGEEKKVDYDLIDYAIGTYKDVYQTHLLTLEEYANSTEESVSEVQKRIDIARIIVEFVEYVKLPERYYIAREYQVYSVFDEMLPVLNKLNEAEKEQLKNIVFNNVLLQANRDQRKFIRDIKKLVSDNTYREYFDNQRIINILIHEKFDSIEVTSKNDLDDFANNNAILKEKLRNSIEHSLQSSKDKKALLKPIENVTKSVSLMAEVDENTFNKMNAEEKEELLDGINRLSNVLDEYGAKLGTDEKGQSMIHKPLRLAVSNSNNPIIICKNIGEIITSDSFTVKLTAVKECDIQSDNCEVQLYFMDSSYNIVSSVESETICVDQEAECNLTVTKDNEEDLLYLIIRLVDNDNDEAIRIIPFELDR
ncbi:Swt1 family HEPN domain-containing protein [Butyrivibrio fibrisolvens]|uniref:Swt1 family HEPN domain-containing protein n=1 Tax=Butyrivibrio fibrisolvens TaxID=831 RepID=UPI0004255ADD|nr:Swt1 family HEPN domain-containing protein [Butyrivibrio fibrisolvens]